MKTSVSKTQPLYLLLWQLGLLALVLLVIRPIDTPYHFLVMGLALIGAVTSAMRLVWFFMRSSERRGRVTREISMAALAIVACALTLGVAWAHILETTTV